MRTLKALVMLAVLGAVIVPVAARADTAVRANIPFEFAAGDATLPAGIYQFEKQHNGRAMVVWSLDQPTRIVVLVHPAYSPKRARAATEVVFNKYGDRYFLAEVWSAASGNGQRVTKSRQEREASLKASAQTVLVAAN